MLNNIELYNEHIQTSSIIYSTMSRPSVNTNTVFISLLVVEVYWFEHGAVHPQITNFDKLCVIHVPLHMLKA